MNVGSTTVLITGGTSDMGPRAGPAVPPGGQRGKRVRSPGGHTTRSANPVFATRYLGVQRGGGAGAGGLFRWARGRIPPGSMCSSIMPASSGGCNSPPGRRGRRRDRRPRSISSTGLTLQAPHSAPPDAGAPGYRERHVRVGVRPARRRANLSRCCSGTNSRPRRFGSWRSCRPPWTRTWADPACAHSACPWRNPPMRG